MIGIGAARDTWDAEIASEEKFWSEWFATRGGAYASDYQNRLNPETPLQDRYCELLALRPEQQEFSILDIGAGPLTLVGKKWGDKKLRITATDALADAYDRILERSGVVPPVRTSWCHGELLAERFPKSSFDLVVATNTLDHSYDPIRIIENAVRICKPGAHVCLGHGVNEAQREHYTGLHQWNFCADGPDFVVWNRTVRFNLTQHLLPSARVMCTTDAKKGWVWATLQKRG